MKWWMVLFTAFGLDLIFAGETLSNVVLTALPWTMSIVGMVVVVIMVLVQFALATVIVPEKSVVRFGLLVSAILGGIFVLTLLLPGFSMPGALASLLSGIVPAYTIGAILYLSGMMPGWFKKQMPVVGW